MKKNRFDVWMTRFGKAWSERNVDDVMSLFDRRDITYFESVFTPPIRSWEIVKKLWDVVPANQKDISFSHDILQCSKTQAVIHWTASRFYIPKNEKQDIDGIFQISLNDKGLCTFFKQWRMVHLG
jgi:hypothetical protein